MSYPESGKNHNNTQKENMNNPDNPDCSISGFNGHGKCERMNKLNVNLKEATNYLIQFFYRTGKKYSCTNTKIGKLLSIVAFVYARKGEMVFAEPVLRYSRCGSTVSGLQRFMGLEAYIAFTYQDDKQRIESELDDMAVVPEIYKDVDSLSDSVKTVIEDVFRKFGSYSAFDLGQCINPIIDCDGITKENNEIDLERISKLKYDSFQAGGDFLDIIDYLFTL